MKKSSLTWKKEKDLSGEAFCEDLLEISIPFKGSPFLFPYSSFIHRISTFFTVLIWRSKRKDETVSLVGFRI